MVGGRYIIWGTGGTESRPEWPGAALRIESSRKAARDDLVVIRVNLHLRTKAVGQTARTAQFRH